MINVLWLCTGNSCRSILAEAILSNLGTGKFNSYSAGSFPTGEVNTAAKSLLREKGYDISKFNSQSWDEFESIKFDLVITLCDSAAGESCPIYLNKCLKVHWGFPDPVAEVNSADKRSELIEYVYGRLYKQISMLVKLDFSQTDGQLESRINKIHCE